MSRQLLIVCLLLVSAVGFANAQGAPPAEAAPEEPDYAFVAGGPYTQIKNSVQIIHQFGYGTRRFNTAGGRANEDEFLWFFRTEYGITDRWELDIMTPFAGNRQRLNGSTVSSAYGYSDTTIGVRYRFLDEETAPFILTMGPQVILGTGSVSKGTGAGSSGFAWDIAAAKDWGGPIFLFQSFNYSVLPSANDTTPGSTRNFALHGAEWATAIGLRALERETSAGGNHDIHVFLEGAGAWGHEVLPGVAVGTKESALAWQFSPGVRYGFLTAKKTLIEIGVSVPIGLGPNGPKKGIVIQFQFERLFGQ